MQVPRDHPSPKGDIFPRDIPPPPVSPREISHPKGPQSSPRDTSPPGTPSYPQGIISLLGVPASPRDPARDPSPVRGLSPHSRWRRREAAGRAWQRGDSAGDTAAPPHARGFISSGGAAGSSLTHDRPTGTAGPRQPPRHQPWGLRTRASTLPPSLPRQSPPACTEGLGCRHRACREHGGHGRDTGTQHRDTACSHRTQTWYVAHVNATQARHTDTDVTCSHGTGTQHAATAMACGTRQWHMDMDVACSHVTGAWHTGTAVTHRHSTQTRHTWM